MKTILIAILSVFLFLGTAFAEDLPADSSVQYIVNVGDGTTLVIFGNENTTTVGQALDEEQKPIYNKIYLKGDVWYEISGVTEIEIDGVVTVVDQIIKRYHEDTWELVWPR